MSYYIGHLQLGIRWLHPKETNISSPGGLTPHQSRRLQAGSYFFSGITMANYAWKHWANHPTSWGICTPTTLPHKTPGADMGTLPEEMSNAMGHLLSTRASIDAHQRKQISDFEMAIYQNEAEATEAIREAKTHCGAAIREAETHHATNIREAEAHCATTIMEAEGHCTTDIREAESCCADHACIIQQSHSDNMQCLQRKTMEE